MEEGAVPARCPHQRSAHRAANANKRSGAVDLSLTSKSPPTDQEILRRLEKEKILVFTPSRRVQGRRVVCYDDRFIVKLAYESDGIIVSNDNYRDLANEKPEWKKFIDERLLMYSFVNDKYVRLE